MSLESEDFPSAPFESTSFTTPQDISALSLQRSGSSTPCHLSPEDIIPMPQIQARPLGKERKRVKRVPSNRK